MWCSFEQLHQHIAVACERLAPAPEPFAPKFLELLEQVWLLQEPFPVLGNGRYPGQVASDAKGISERTCRPPRHCPSDVDVARLLADIHDRGLAAPVLVRFVYHRAPWAENTMSSPLAASS